MTDVLSEQCACSNIPCPQCTITTCSSGQVLIRCRVAREASNGFWVAHLGPHTSSGTVPCDEATVCASAEKDYTLAAC